MLRRIFLAVLLSVLLVVCCVLTQAIAASSQPVPPAASVMTLKFGISIAPGTPNHECLVKFKELVESRTNGAIQVEVYPSSQLGDDREMIEGMQMGTVDGYFGSVAPLTAWISEFMLFDIAFLFDSYEHEYKVLDSELGDRLKALCLPLGIHPFSLTDIGFSNIINNGRPINTPADAVGMSIRCMESAGLMAYFSSMGANPVPMAMSETFTAIQNGTVDGGTWPIYTTYFNKLYTITDYLTLTDPIPTTCIFAISEATWQKVPAEYQDILTLAGKEATAHQRVYTAEGIDRLLAEMETEGLTVVRPDRAVWKEALFQKCVDAIVPRYASQEMIDMVNAAR